MLEFVHDNNVELVRELTEDINAAEKNSPFLPALQISESAWQARYSTGLMGYVEFDLIVTLSETYALVDVYRRTG